MLQWKALLCDSIYFIEKFNCGKQEAKEMKSGSCLGRKNKSEGEVFF